MATVTRKKLIRLVSRKTGVHETQAQTVVESLLQNIISALWKGQRIELRGFGVFDTIHVRSYECKDPRNGNVVVVAEGRRIRFRPGYFLQKSNLPDLPINE